MTNQSTPSATTWSAIGVGFVFALAIAVIAGIRLQVVNVLPAAVVAVAAGMGSAALAGLVATPPATKPPRPRSPEVEPPQQPVPREPVRWLDPPEQDDPFDRADSRDPAAGAQHTKFVWHHLVAEAWQPGAQCARCAEPVSGSPERCRRCGASLDAAREPVRISTSGPFLEAIERLRDSGGSDV